MKLRAGPGTHRMPRLARASRPGSYALTPSVSAFSMSMVPQMRSSAGGEDMAADQRAGHGSTPLIGEAEGQHLQGSHLCRAAECPGPPATAPPAGSTRSSLAEWHAATAFYSHAMPPTTGAQRQLHQQRVHALPAGTTAAQGLVNGLTNRAHDTHRWHPAAAPPAACASGPPAASRPPGGAAARRGP